MATQIPISRNLLTLLRNPTVNPQHLALISLYQHITMLSIGIWHYGDVDVIFWYMDNKKQRLTVYLEPKLIEDIKIYAIKQKLSLSELFEKITKQEIKKKWQRF